MAGPESKSPDSIFRPQAIQERFARHIETDHPNTITSARDWLVLSAIFSIVVTVLFWMIAGRISTTISGQGIFVRQSGTLAIEATVGGLIQTLKVSVGDLVDEGQVLATLDQQKSLEQLARAKEVLVENQKGYDELLERQSTEKELKLANIVQQKARLNDRIALSKARAEALEEEIDRAKSLSDLGYLTSQVYRQREAELNTERFRIADDLTQIEKLEAERVDLLIRHEREKFEAEALVSEARRRVDELSETSARDSAVKSPASGYIVELSASAGSTLEVSDKIAVIEPTDSELRGYVFLEPNFAKLVKPGMSVRVSPSTVRKEEYGSIVAKVLSVSKFPVSENAVVRLIPNQTFVNSFFADGPKFLVEIELSSTSSTPSGYIWSSGAGPSQIITSGTLLAASIETESRRPIELVFPSLKRLASL